MQDTMREGFWRLLDLNPPSPGKTVDFGTDFSLSFFFLPVPQGYGGEPGSRQSQNNIVRVCVKASPAEGWRRLHTNTAYAHLWGLSRKAG